ncbi:hypothetical protein H5410_024044 [Solanum commersonii]|uniref:Uncharacterized protein n=1 Tax=Solanum commersonii TaxID=4109 RepID=A0A9J5ZKU9_SOLCO|nr:hypothetical protein H5410_024044 [Solanum commersonii]
MEPVGNHDQNNPFSRSNNPRTGQMSPGAGKPPISPIFACYSSPSFLVIWNSDLIFVEIFHRRPLRP